MNNIKDISTLYREWDENTKPSIELMRYISENPFRLLNIKLVNYKSFSKKVFVEFENNKRSVLFIGINASGKTTIVEAIAKALSKINSAIYNKNNDSGDTIEEKNIHRKGDNTFAAALIELNLGYKDSLTEIILAKSPAGAPKTVSSILSNARKLGRMYSYILGEKDLDLPLYMFYGVDRSSFKNKENFDKANIILAPNRLDAISQKLVTLLKFDEFLLWLRYLDDSKNQDLARALESMSNDIVNIEKTFENLDENNITKGLSTVNEIVEKLNNLYSLHSKLEKLTDTDKGKNTKTRDLKIIKETICSFIPELKDIRIDRNQSYPFIAEKKDGSQFLLSELSAGEKSIISLIGDLARRMLILNPHKENPLETPAIVIIDELELHLHPKWQEEIIPKLEKTFKNTKFILTSHTPTILSSIINENLYIMGNRKVSAAKFGNLGTYGAEYSRIYTDIYEINSRPKNDITEDLATYLGLINEDKYDSEEAIKLRKKLDNHFKGSEPALDKATLIIENKKWEKSIYEKNNKT